MLLGLSAPAGPARAWAALRRSGPRILPFLKASPFRERFERKGRFQDYMAAIPTHVILHKHAALLGAARVAFAAEG